MCGIQGYDDYYRVNKSEKPELPEPAVCQQSFGSFGVEPSCVCPFGANGVQCSNGQLFDQKSALNYTCNELMQMTTGKPAAACTVGAYQHKCTYRQFVDDNKQPSKSISVCNIGDSVEVPVKGYDEACWKEGKTNLSVICIDGDGNTSVFDNTKLSCSVLVPAAQQLTGTTDLQNKCTIDKPCSLGKMADDQLMHVFNNMETPEDITKTLNFKATGDDGPAWCNQLTSAGIETPDGCSASQSVTTPT